MTIFSAERGRSPAASRHLFKASQFIGIPEEGGFGLKISQSSEANHGAATLPCVSSAKLCPCDRPRVISGSRGHNAGLPPDNVTRTEWPAVSSSTRDKISDAVIGTHSLRCLGRTA